MLVEIGLVSVFLWIRRRYISRPQLTTPIYSEPTAIYSEPTAPVKSQQGNSRIVEAHGYVVPLTAFLPSVYQELSKVRPNEDNVYQGLVSQAE